MEAFIDKYDTWLLDCDGVIWLGDEAVSGVPSFLSELRRRGKRIFFVSNNASKHRSTYLAKFKKLNMAATVDDVITSALGAGQVRNSVAFPLLVFFAIAKGNEASLHFPHHTLTLHSLQAPSPKP